MTAVDRTYSIEEFMRLPSPIEGGQYELVNGELRLMSPAGEQHNLIEGAIFALLRQFVREHKLGRVYTGDMGFKIFPNASTVRSPDVSFVAQSQLSRVNVGFLPFPPDLAIEVMSPNDAWDEVTEKIEEYQRAGVRLIWVAVPRRKAIYVYHSDPAVKADILTFDDTLGGEDVVPGFVVKVSTLFDMDE